MAQREGMLYCAGGRKTGDPTFRIYLADSAVASWPQEADNWRQYLVELLESEDYDTGEIIAQHNAGVLDRVSRPQPL